MFRYIIYRLYQTSLLILNSNALIDFRKRHRFPEKALKREGGGGQTPAPPGYDSTVMPRSKFKE